MRILIVLSLVVGVFAVAPEFSAAQAVEIDSGRSSIKIHVEKSGLFSAFAHNHVIEAPLASGKVDVEKRTVELTFHAKEMKVLDEGVKDSERSDIDQTMKGEKCLDVGRFPEIRFVSTSVTPQGTDRFQVRGNLTLHGVTKPVELSVALVHDRYTGSVKLKQTDFSMTPVTVAGGTVKVKDVIEIVFEIVPSR